VSGARKRLSRRGILDKDDRRDMERWDRGGRFFLNANERIEANDRRGLERLLRYCARAASGNPLILKDPLPGRLKRGVLQVQRARSVRLGYWPIPHQHKVSQKRPFSRTVLAGKQRRCCRLMRARSPVNVSPATRILSLPVVSQRPMLSGPCDQVIGPQQLGVVDCNRNRLGLQSTRIQDRIICHHRHRRDRIICH
jgi:hypothetical protein